MNILLCSKNDSVLDRWEKALTSKYLIFQTNTIGDAWRIMQKNEINCTLLHRLMVNEQQIREIIGSKADQKIFIMSDRPNNEEGISCLRLGCVGYANTYIAPQRLELATQAIVSGLIWTGSSLMQHMIKTSTAGSTNPGEGGTSQSPLLTKLSKREYQVATLVAEGLHNRQVAQRLDITERTVKAHLSSAYAKTSTQSRLGLARLFSTA